jgi:hypothetical protein
MLLPFFTWQFGTALARCLKQFIRRREVKFQGEEKRYECDICEIYFVLAATFRQSYAVVILSISAVPRGKFFCRFSLINNSVDTSATQDSEPFQRCILSLNKARLSVEGVCF